MAIKDFYNSVESGIGKVTTPLKNILSSSQAYAAVPVKATPVPVAPVNVNPDDAMYQQASQAAQKKYGVVIPPHFIKSVRQQESSNIVDPNDYGRSFGLVNADGANGAKVALGKDYLPDTSLVNSAQNAANYAAYRAHLKNDDGSIRVDLSTPENLSKLYVQRYVGLLPGKSRIIGGQKVSYDEVKNSFEKILKNNQPQDE